MTFDSASNLHTKSVSQFGAQTSFISWTVYRRVTWQSLISQTIYLPNHLTSWQYCNSGTSCNSHTPGLQSQLLITVVCAWRIKWVRLKSCFWLNISKNNICLWQLAIDTIIVIDENNLKFALRKINILEYKLPIYPDNLS